MEILYGLCDAGEFVYLKYTDGVALQQGLKMSQIWVVVGMRYWQQFDCSLHFESWMRVSMVFVDHDGI